MWLRICLIIFFSSSLGPALVSPVCDSVASQSVHSEPHPTAGSGSVPTGGHSRTLVSRILPYANQVDYDSDIDLVGDWENQCRPRPTSAGLDDISGRAARSGFLWDGVALKPVEELSPMNHWRCRRCYRSRVILGRTGFDSQFPPEAVMKSELNRN